MLKGKINLILGRMMTMIDKSKLKEISPELLIWKLMFMSF
jgi:hypothetical protein